MKFLKMAIFGDIYWNYTDGRGRVLLYSNPLECLMLNISFGTIYILLLVTSLVFNPVVFA